MGLLRCGTMFIYVLLLLEICMANDQHIHQIYPGFAASRLDWNDHGGFFLLSNSSAFAFGFFGTLDVSLFVLVVIHLSSYKVVWTANRALLVRNSDKFVFDHSGNAYLESGKGVVWATNTTGQKVRAMELEDSGNLVLLGENRKSLWQSFDHPTDTLLPGQAFVEGMRLKSFPNRNNLFHYLGYISGDLVLYAGFDPPQQYWSLSEVAQKNDSGKFHLASLVSNSWNFYDKSGTLIWKSVFSDHSDPKSLWVAILDPNGAISFYDLNKVGLITGFWYYNKKKNFDEYPQETLEEDDFLDNLSGMPTRFTYAALSRATKDFSTKIGEGGFGSVYLGLLEDGTQLAVKKLEGVGQGTKEFKAEVSMIGSIHHVHLIKLKGFCAEGPHRLLVYEYMARGSLDKWIFKNSDNTLLLNWDTRYNIAIGTAKGLAYLHEECEVRIIHCDIKPQNVLLDDNFSAKVSDFGLAKLMSREQSHVFTTLRGTRGYLAPEWITNYAISEKSDVFSYGMVLLEIIGGRKNYDQWEGSEKAHFPSYVFRMMEEGKLEEVLDQKIDIDDKDERVVTALKVALWCIQDDGSLRPSMTKVTQMLEGLCPVPDPPSLSHSATYSAFLKMTSSGEATSSGQASFYSNVPLSCVQLSGPR
ncbi:putative protein kinase RLK-Pelle-SD-2b family [Lupinus albus]|uniref:non-specific serine/threonine protein kinase n=1 Tax=Lupinus albus TaxID=3870 RepID=A0A6A4PG89_LUPAL|nr:putative protein kinase RLK-Pelle-SD-2b family [Lupinus albus]